eukprot:5528610-Pyramimonas_sp.AAC.1
MAMVAVLKLLDRPLISSTSGPGGMSKPFSSSMIEGLVWLAPHASFQILVWWLKRLKKGGGGVTLVLCNKIFLKLTGKLGKLVGPGGTSSESFFTPLSPILPLLRAFFSETVGFQLRRLGYGPVDAAEIPIPLVPAAVGAPDRAKGIRNNKVRQLSALRPKSGEKGHPSLRIPLVCRMRRRVPN